MKVTESWFSVGAQLMALLNPSNTEKAVKLTTQLDSSLSGVSIQVSGYAFFTLHI